MQFFGETHINFVDFRNKAFILSLVLILAGLGSLAIKGGPNLSIDFEAVSYTHLTLPTTPYV